MNARLSASVALPYGTRATRIFGAWYSFPDYDTHAAVSALSGAADVVEPNYVVQADGYIESALLSQVNAPLAWQVTDGAGVTIAVIDTGADCTHPALASRCAGDADDNGHGTHTAGLAAGLAPSARVRAYKALDWRGSGDLAGIAEAITRAADDGARVVNLSLGCVNCPSQLMADAVSYAQARGAVVVASAGNHGGELPSVPALYAFAVAAVDGNDTYAGFSGYGDWVDASAPGVQLLSTCMGGGYCRMTGTSMSAPVVAGVAALVVAAHPDEGVSQIEARLADGDAVTSPHPIGRRVNAAKAVGAAPLPQPSSTPLPGPRPSVTPGDFAARTVQLVNAQRRAFGLADYRIDARLAAAADFHNRWMRDHDCFAHICPDEPDPWTRIRNAGYPMTAASENIGAGYVTPEDMVTAWMNSAGHRLAILGDTTDIGCAYLGASGNSAPTIQETAEAASYPTYWTCDFARGATTVPPPAWATATQVRPQPTQPMPTATPYGAGYHMVVIADAGNKTLWDDLYTRYCYPPRPDVRCEWPREGGSVTP